MEGQPEPQETTQEARKHPRSAKAIGESEEWLFTALQSVGDAIIATNAAGLIIFMNLVAVTLTGWSEDEAQGKDCREVFRIVNETTRKETESPVTKVIRDGVISGLANHTILIARDGTEHNIDDSGSPIRDKDGKLIGVVLIFRDVTERRKGEQTRQEQQEILQTLFDHIPVIVTFLDDKGQFKWFNREWTRVLGWSMDEMRETERLNTFSTSLLAEQQAEVADKTLASGWRDLTLTVKDGRSMDLTWAIVRLSDGTSIGIGQDVTERKRAEALIGNRTTQLEKRNQRLEQAMRETDHRIKNNLQSVAAMLDLKVMEHEATVPVNELTSVRTHINTLALIHEMLVSDLKGDGGMHVLSAKAAMERLLPMLQQVVGARRIHWSVDEIYLPLKQGISLAVLINELVNNAVKHGGQTVDLRLAVVKKEITLEVCDDGPGFPATFQSAASPGFGLELVESVGRLDLGGRTTFENRPEGGACVRVIFPIPAALAAFA